MATKPATKLHALGIRRPGRAKADFYTYTSRRRTLHGKNVVHKFDYTRNNIIMWVFDDWFVVSGRQTSCACSKRRKMRFSTTQHHAISAVHISDSLTINASHQLAILLDWPCTIHPLVFRGRWSRCEKPDGTDSANEPMQSFYSRRSR